MTVGRSVCDGCAVVYLEGRLLCGRCRLVGDARLWYGPMMELGGWTPKGTLNVWDERRR